MPNIDLCKTLYWKMNYFYVLRIIKQRGPEKEVSIKIKMCKNAFEVLAS